MKNLKINKHFLPKDPLQRVALYLGLVWFTLWQPVIVIFWLKNGLSMENVMLLKSLHGIALLLFEVPTGIVTDKFGAKISLVLASIVYVISLIIYVAGHSFYVFLLAEIVAALGTALISGSDSAYIYTLLDRTSNADKFSEILGKIHSFRLLSQTVATIIGGFLAQFLSLRSTLTFTIIPNALSFFVAISLPNVKTHSVKRKVPFKIFKDGLRALFSSARNAVLAMNYILIASAGLLLFWMYQPFLKFLGIPVAYFGIFTAAFNITAMLFSMSAGKFDKLFGSGKTILLINILLVVSAFLAGSLVGGKYAVLFLFGLQAVRGLQSPIFHKPILNNTNPDSRATVLSILEMLVRLSFIVFAPIVGMLANKNGVVLSIKYIAMSAGMIVILLYAVLTLKRFHTS